MRQFVVRAVLHQAPLLHHQNPVGAAHGRQAMGDDDGGVATPPVFQGIENAPFGAGVHRRKRIVQHQERGLQHHADLLAQPLPLHLAHVHAVGEDAPGVAVWRSGKRRDSANARASAGVVPSVTRRGLAGRDDDLPSAEGHLGREQRPATERASERR